VLLGAFVNARAVAHAVQGTEALAFVLAGTHGAFTLEDALAAGAILARLGEMGAALEADDMAAASIALYECSRDNPHRLLSKTRHYQRLCGLGLTEDVRYCLTEDVLGTVPVQQEDGWFR